VGELAGLPGILGAISADEAVALQGDAARAIADAQLAEIGERPSQVQALARSVSRRRGRTRRRVAGLVVGVGAVLALGGAFTGVLVGQSAGTPPAAVSTAPEPSAPATAPPGSGTSAARAMAQVEPGYLDADLVVSEKGWGTRFDWNCSYRDEWATGGGPTTYDLVVTDGTGSETTVASWTAKGTAAGNLSASTSIPTTDIRSVDIRVAGSDRPLVRTVL
jgi:hypothetical protein